MENPDDTKENFYSSFRTAIRKIPPRDKLVLIGDFIARVGTDAKKWPEVTGYHGIGKCDSNGEPLLALCSENELTIMNTVFKYRERYNEHILERKCHKQSGCREGWPSTYG